MRYALLLQWEVRELHRKNQCVMTAYRLTPPQEPAKPREQCYSWAAAREATPQPFGYGNASARYAGSSRRTDSSLPDTRSCAPPDIWLFLQRNRYVHLRRNS